MANDVNFVLDATNAPLDATILGHVQQTVPFLPIGDVAGDGSGEIGIKVIIVGVGTGGSGLFSVQGNVADNAALVSAKPVLVSGRAVTTASYAPAYAANDNANLAVDATSGRLLTDSAEKRYTGAPSNSTPATADATVFTLAAGERGFIQNLDDAALAVKLAASASSSSFSLILKAGSAADDGLGGSIEIKDHVGVVSVAAMAGTARYIAWKQAP